MLLSLRPLVKGRLIVVVGPPATDAEWRPAMGTVAYHIRPGKHDVTDFDWDRYMDFADKHLRK